MSEPSQALLDAARALRDATSRPPGRYGWIAHRSSGGRYVTSSGTFATVQEAVDHARAVLESFHERGRWRVEVHEEGGSRGRVSAEIELGG